MFTVGAMANVLEHNGFPFCVVSCGVGAGIRRSRVRQELGRCKEGWIPTCYSAKAEDRFLDERRLRTNQSRLVIPAEMARVGVLVKRDAGSFLVSASAQKGSSAAYDGCC